MKQATVLSCILLAACAGGTRDFEEAERDCARPDQPDAAVAQRLTTLQDEFGRIPHNAQLTAQAQAALLPAAATAGGLDQTKWTALGPGNIGGRTRAIAIHPTTPTTIFLGGVAGGIWKSTNGGTTWSGIDDLMANLAITSIVFTPGNSNVMYASTGESFRNADSIRGAGIFKSVDGGTTWAQLPSTNTADFYWVARLSISPDASTLLAATRDAGLWRSTDAGATFTRVYGTSGTRCQDVKFHPNNSSVAIAHSGEPTTTTSTVVHSTNGGQTWNLSSGIATTTSSGYRIEVAWHRGYTGAGNGCAYAMHENGSAVYRSLDGGATWTLVATTSILGSQGWYDNVIWVDPSDTDANPADDVVVAGGIDLYRSTNGGTSFTKISAWASWPNSAHADQHRIIEHPNFDGTTNTTVYFGNDGGIWRVNNIYTVSNTSGWINLNSGLPITQFYGGSRNATTGTVIGGTQDNGTLRYTPASGPNAWTTMYGGDGGFCASNQTNSNYHYGEYVYAQIHRSSNGGTSSSNIYSGLGDAGSSTNSLFISPFVLDPNVQTTLLVGGTSLWRSTTATSSTLGWAAIKSPIASNSKISAIAVATGDSNVIWVGYNNGDVWYTTNGTAAAPTWTQRDLTSPPLPNRYCTRVTIDPKDKNHVLATFGGYNTDNIWQSTDSGANWIAATGMPSAPVRDVEQHEAIPTWLYAATEIGLLVSEDNGLSWTRSATPANVSIDELLWSGHQLFVITHGRGMFSQSPYPAPSTTSIGSACTINGPLLGPSITATSPKLGTTLTWNMAQAPANGTAAIYVSAIPPGATLLSPGCYAQIDLLGAVLVSTQSVSAAGTAAFTFPLPDSPALAGIAVMSQGVAFDPTTTALSVSNGIKVALGY